MAVIDQVMFYAVFGLAGLVLALMAVWTWVETSVSDPRRNSRQSRD